MRKFNKDVLCFLLSLYVAELVYPPITVIVPSIYICLACLSAWFVISFCSFPDYYMKCKIRVFLIIVLYLYAGIFPRLAGNGTMANRYLGLALVFCGYIIYDFHKVTRTTDIIRRVLIVAIVLSLITAIKTTNALIAEPYISRSIKSSGEYSRNLAAM